MTNSGVNIDSLFHDTEASWDATMNRLLMDASVSQVAINRYDRVFYISKGNTNFLPNVFPHRDAYIGWLNSLMLLTDVGYSDVLAARTEVIEGSFDPLKVAIHGSIHLCTREIAPTGPLLTIRKQPIEAITLVDMLRTGMLNQEMVQFLEQAMRGRSNILISGGSGAGKTTLARALSFYIDGSHRVVSVEEIDELHLYDRLPNVAPLITYKDVAENGQVIRRVELEDLVREALRMRPDRIWVGETRGREASALVKACNSGHDGSVTTIHADDAKTAVKQATSYVMEAGIPEEVAREQVSRGIDLVVQISRVDMGRRVVSEITEVESTTEGREVRLNDLWKYDHQRRGPVKIGTGSPSTRLAQKWARYGVQLAGPAGVSR